MAPDRSKAGGNRNRPDVLTDPRAIQRVHLDHHQISSHQNVVKTIQDTPITDLKDVKVDKASDDFAAGQSLVWGGDSWIAGDPEVLIPVKAAEEMSKGTPVYVSDEQASGKPIVSKAASDGTDTYPAIGLLSTDLALGEDGHAVGGGIISGLDTTAYTGSPGVGDPLYISSTSGVLTGTRPTATNEKVQKVAVIARSHGFAGTLIVMGAGRTNDIPNDLVTLTGVPLGDSDLGTFTGTTIADNETIKGALQDLETSIESQVQYHSRYDTEAETQRSGATATTEIYYTARPDGDGYAENEITTSTPAGAVIVRRLYFSDKFDADPNTSGDWTLYTTQPANDTAFATAKASLLAGLSDTDGTANTRGTLPVSLMMTHRFSTDLLLDDYPNAGAAYSVRKLRTAYSGSALRVREDSGNTETDIGFDGNGDLDTAAIASHCGANNGYVVTFYDQSGNSVDATQATTSQQPQIYNGTAVITKNGKPAIDFAGNGIFLNYATSTLNLGTNDHLVAGVVSVGTTADSNQVWFEEETSGSNRFVLWWESGSNHLELYHNTFVGTGYSSTKGQQYLLTAERVGTSSKLYVDGGLGPNGTAADFTSSGGDLKIGIDYANNTNQSWDGVIQEVIAWPSDQSSNRTGIESNINTYFSIY